ncbi:hypothetical protein DPMN_132452 [Dreissena polymorpha]|uniref:Uncharacterized protein n=1 Tax=Dreissena polymorpha TaxID=45954 RepID=A0A9D4JA41_DREPO|nr:hypothetical protein DPMN_132452 [Dreissena polymorpha]
MVVSTHDELHHVRMISVDGLELDFEHLVFPTKNYKSDQSKCTYVQSKNTLVLTDRFAYTVFMYDTSKATPRAVTTENIQGPDSVCVGPSETVLVCSQNNHSIVHLSVNGDLPCGYAVPVQQMCVQGRY